MAVVEEDKIDIVSLIFLRLRGKVKSIQQAM